MKLEKWNRGVKGGMKGRDKTGETPLRVTFPLSAS